VVRTWWGQNLTRVDASDPWGRLWFDDDEIDSISNADSGLTLKKCMVPLINCCTRHLLLAVRRGRTVITSVLVNKIRRISPAGFENFNTLRRERTSGQAWSKEEEIMSSRVDVGCTKSPRSTKMVFLVFRRGSDPEGLHLGYLCSLP